MKKSNANLWAQCSCNRLIAERIEGRTHQHHLKALGGCRSVTDHKAPQQFPHLKNKVNTRKMQENRAADIQLENRILLQKMLDIDTKPSQFSADNTAFSRHPPKSIHGPAHCRELDRISAENQKLLKRLQTAKSEFDLHGLEEMEIDRQALKHRLSQNSCRGRSANLPTPLKPVMSMPNLPRIGQPCSQGLRFKEEDWAKLTNNELDKRLEELEANQRYKPDLM